MTTNAATAAPFMTYARARLFLGASAVGTLTVIAGLALLLDFPARLLPNDPGSLVADVAWLTAVVVAHAAVMAPFDLFGGWLLPREYGRSAEALPRFVLRWWRGAVVYAASLALLASLLMLAARWAGAVGMLVAFVLLSLVMLWVQPWLAAVLGFGRLVRPKAADAVADLGNRSLIVNAEQVHVSGGAYGLPGRTGWVTPRRWLDAGARVALDEQVLRRRWLTRSGARDRGVLVALVWNGLAVVLMLALHGAPLAVADVVRLGLASTVWSFVGLLVLPTPSRWAVYRADLAALEAGAERTVLCAGLRELERDQDDELERSKGIETIFHPVPASGHRQAVMADERAPGPAGVAAWHAARVALFLSWAGFGMLGRAVHCNVGRPEVWVFLPSD